MALKLIDEIRNNRYERIVQMRLSGMTYKAIAYKMGISSCRVQQIIKSYERKTGQKIDVRHDGIVEWIPARTK